MQHGSLFRSVLLVHLGGNKFAIDPGLHHSSTLSRLILHLGAVEISPRFLLTPPSQNLLARLQFLAAKGGVLGPWMAPMGLGNNMRS